MLRDKNLIPLSRQHQHALALCVRIERASPVADDGVAAWLAEVAEHFRAEIRIHFTAEEAVLFPAARKFDELSPLVEELVVDHAALRAYFDSAECGALSAAELQAFAQRLSAHVRKEERRLFERMQDLMTAEELAALGARLAKALEGAAQVCVVPKAGPGQ